MSFHVPEASRLITHPQLGSTAADGNNGMFTLPSPEPGWTLAVLCSDGMGWEHVSVHAYRGGDCGTARTMRTPTWKDMCFVKDTCWDDEDVVMQLHPRKSAYVNQHPHVLHLWRPTHATIPEPLPIQVGLR